MVRVVGVNNVFVFHDYHLLTRFLLCLVPFEFVFILDIAFFGPFYRTVFLSRLRRTLDTF